MHPWEDFIERVAEAWDRASNNRRQATLGLAVCAFLIGGIFVVSKLNLLDTSPSAAIAQASGGPPIPEGIEKPLSDIDGPMWLDIITLPPGCRHLSNPTYFYLTGASLFRKRDSDPWPPVRDGEALADAMPPSPMIWGENSQAPIFDAAIAALIRRSIATEVAGQSYLQEPVRCLRIDTSKLGVNYNIYNGNSAGITTHIQVRVGYLAYAGHEFVSEFQKMVPFQGTVATYRKYRLNANVLEYDFLGGQRFDLQRDLIIFFDPIDRIWRQEGNYAWHLKGAEL